MSEVVGEAVLRYTIDKSDAEAGMRGVESDAEKSGNSAGSRFSGGFKKALKVGAAGITAALGIGAALYKVGSGFDEVNDTIQAGTGKTGKALAGLEDDARSVGKRIPLAFDAIGPVITALNQRLGLAGKPLQDLAEQFLDLQHLTGEAVDTDAITGALNLFNVKGADTSKVLDQLFRVTQASGIKFNDLGGILARQGPILKQFGFSIGDSADLIGSLYKAGIDPSRTLGTLSRAMAGFAKAGLEPRKALNDTIAQIQELVKQGDIAGATDIAGKVFGTRGASQFVAAVQSGRLNLKQLDDLTKGNTNTIVGTTKATEDFSERLQVLKNRVLLQLEPIANRVFDAIGSGAKAVTTSGVLPKISGAIRRVAHDFAPTLRVGEQFGRRVIPQIGGAIASAAPKVEHLGKVVGKTVVKAVTDLTEVLGPLVVEAAQFAESFVRSGALDKTVDVLGELGHGLTAVTGFLSDHGVAVRAILLTVLTAVAAYKAYTTALAVTKAATAAFRDAQAALNVVMDANPIALVVIALAALAVGLIYAYKHSETFRHVVDSIGHALAKVPGYIGAVVDFVKDHWPLILALITGPIGLAVLFVVKHFDQIRDVIGKAVGFVVDSLKAWDKFKSGVISKVGDVLSYLLKLPSRIQNALVSKMKDAGQAVIGAFFRGLSTAGSFVGHLADTIRDAVVGVVNHVIDTLNDAIPNSIGKGPLKVDLPANPIPHLARGTDNWRGGVAWVGEEGPELVALPAGARVTPAADSAAAAAGTTINIGTLMPHDYGEFTRSMFDQSRVAALGSRRPYGNRPTVGALT